MRRCGQIVLVASSTVYLLSFLLSQTCSSANSHEHGELKESVASNVQSVLIREHPQPQWIGSRLGRD